MRNEHCLVDFTLGYLCAWKCTFQTLLSKMIWVLNYWYYIIRYFDFGPIANKKCQITPLAKQLEIVCSIVAHLPANVGIKMGGIHERFGYV